MFRLSVLADLHRSAPDLLAGLRVQTLQLIVVELAQEGAVSHRPGHAAVADPVDLGLHPVRIDRDQRNGRLSALGQDIGTAQESNHGGAVAHVDVQIDVLGQSLAIDGRQAGAHQDAVASAVGHTVDADLLTLRLDGQVLAAGNLDEVRQVREVARQRVGEADADPGALGIRVDPVLEDAKAVLRHQLVVGRAHCGIIVRGPGRPGWRESRASTPIGRPAPDP